MKKLLAIFLLTATPAAAAEIDVEVENFTANPAIATVVLKVTNNTARPASSVFVDCIFQNEAGKAVDIGKALISYIQPGSYAYDKASVPMTSEIKQVVCTVVRFRYS